MELTHRYKRLHDLLANAQRVLVIAHKKPDGDALGSTTAMHLWLKRLGKDVALFCADKPGPSYAHLASSMDYSNDPAVFDQPYDAVMVLDSGDLRYAGVDQFMARLPGKPTLVDMDHHATNQFFGDVNVVRPDASSTCEVAYGFFEANGVFIDPEIATALLTGILTDTSHFSNAATTSRVFDAAGKLISLGADTSAITRGILMNKEVPLLRLWGTAFSRLRHNPKYDITFTYLLPEDSKAAGVAPQTTEGLINFLAAVCGSADAVMVVQDTGTGTVKGSFRSVRRNVAAVAKLIGGGGHVKASGFAIDGKLEMTTDGVRVV